MVCNERVDYTLKQSFWLSSLTLKANLPFKNYKGLQVTTPLTGCFCSLTKTGCCVPQLSLVWANKKVS